MKKLTIFLALLLFAGFSVNAQMQITGKVTGAEDGLSIPGVSVVVKGNPTIGTTTNVDGEYSLSVPNAAEALVFSFVGMKTQEVLIGGRSVIDITMESEVLEMDEVVVTALGISREKKSLGYSVQEVGGDAVNEVRESNFINSLSGKVSGVNIKTSNVMGGSSNVIIRGNASLLGNNQALFIVDGVPIDNSITNTDDQEDGWGGYDYGNAAQDINPDDIESVSVLKGAAASALYGSRAANGVILITTKKGQKRKGIGVSVNSGVVWSQVDNSTLPQYQKDYGAGYAAYWDKKDLGKGKVNCVPTYDDAAWGYAYDPDLNVVHWDAMDPAADNYGETRPWVYPENDMKDFWETGIKYTNNVAISAGNDDGTFRLSYTNMDETGIMVNSSMKRNTINLSGSYNLTDKFKVEASANYINNEAVGRFGTGYDELNPMHSMGQWMQPNVDMERLRNNYKTEAGEHRSWNYTKVPLPGEKPVVFYTSNPYWIRYENFNNDVRDRFFGYAKLSYDLTDWAVLEGRVANDYYSEIQEQRRAIGSATAGELPQYSKYLRSFNEFNADLMLRFNKDIDDISLNGLLGTSTRSNTMLSTWNSTEGGLSVPNYFAIDNSVSPATVTEHEEYSNIHSFYGSLSTGYKRLVFVDITGRYDISSTLPEDNRAYFYPSVSTSFILSELDAVKNISIISLLKLRANYAEVGNTADPYKTAETYFKDKVWDGKPIFSVKNELSNAKLKPERMKSIEFGLEANLFNNRLRFDFSYYKTNTFDQILPISVSFATGNSTMVINAGEIENKGYELAVGGTAVQTNDFSWDINVNWFKNVNEVVSLGNEINNILLFSAWDVSVNATEGEPYGAIRGTNFVYRDGKRVVNSDGYYIKSDANPDDYPLAGDAEDEQVIGNVNPDWNAGITNTFRYKNFTLSGLIDIQQGGDIYSVGYKNGLATGLLEETSGYNDKGYPKRDLVSDGGGVRFDAVDENGNENQIYIPANQWGVAYNYTKSPTARYVYDASYVKLRELSLSYALPKAILDKTFFKNITLSFVGRNLWIISKNVDHFDPESIRSAGNNQGIENATYPTTRTYGFNLKLGI